MKTVRRKLPARFAGSKTDLLLGGAAVSSLTYQRASKALTMASVDVQLERNLAVNARAGWTHAGSYTDNDIGASEATDVAERGEWTRLLADIEAGKPGDVLIVTEISRETRDLAVYVELRKLCRAVGLYFWMVNGNAYDLRDKNDLLALGMQAVVAEHTSNAIKEVIIATLASNARAGKPHGKAPYGYARLYDERTRRPKSQHPDEIERVTATGFVYTPAGVIREMYAELLKGTSLMEIAHRLNEHGVPTARMLAAIESGTPMKPSRWDGTEKDKHGRQRKPTIWIGTAVRDLLLSPAYIGQRWYSTDDGERALVAEECWDALVSDELYFAAAGVLLDPRRLSGGVAHGNVATRLCVGIVTCGVCGVTVSGLLPKRLHRRVTPVYKCRSRAGHAACSQAELDDLVEAWVLSWLTRDGNLDRLRTISDTANTEAAAARADAERLRAKLEAHLAQLDDADFDKPLGFDRQARALKTAADDADKRARTVGLSAALRPFAGASQDEAADVWSGLGLSVHRDILRDLVSIKLYPAGKGRGGPRLAERVTFTPLVPE